MKIKNLLFDFDGTLFDTGEGIIKSVKYSARSFGFIEDNPEDLRSFVGPPLLDSFMNRYSIDEETGRKMISKFRERYGTLGINECKPYSDIFECIKELKSHGINILIATGKPTVHAKTILNNFDYTDLFDDILGSDLEGKLTQKKDIIAALIRKWGSDGSVMIGDRDNDVLGALANNLPCLGVAWGYAKEGELKKAGALEIFETPKALLYYLLSSKN